MEKLTEKQNLVYKTIRTHIEKKGYSPTIRELLELLKKEKLPLKSPNSLAQYLDALEKKGLLKNVGGKRGIRLLNVKLDEFFSIPLVGRADCGEALQFADDVIEDYVNVSTKLIKGAKNDYFFIKACGDSMDKEGIHDGDFVLAKKEDGVDSGNVVAVVNGLGVIKKLSINKDELVLSPHSNNTKHQPIFLHPEDQVYICGKVVRVFKRPFSPEN